MSLRCAVLFVVLSTPPVLAQSPRTPQDEILQRTQDWLKAISVGDRVMLNRIMDSRCLITTPAGDILNKDRLVPDDDSRAVQTLPLSELVSPLVRVYNDTAVLMTHLKSSADGLESIATFVFSKQGNTWKLVGLHVNNRK